MNNCDHIEEKINNHGISSIKTSSKIQEVIINKLWRGVTANKFVLSPILPAKKSNEVIENKSRTQSTFYKYGSYTQKKIQNPTNSNQENHSRKKIHEN